MRTASFYCVVFSLLKALSSGCADTVNNAPNQPMNRPGCRQARSTNQSINLAVDSLNLL